MDSILNLIPAVMGMGFIDENLDGLLNAMGSFPDMGTSQIMAWAKIIGCGIALGVGANECYQMILGRRGMDVMKLVHIVIISFCITFSDQIANAVIAPGLAMEKYAKKQVDGKSDLIVDLEKEVFNKSKDYLLALATRRATLEQKQDAQKEAAKDWVQKITDAVDDLTNIVIDCATAAGAAIEQYLCELLSIIIKFIGETLFQISVYGLLVAERVFLNILKAFAPLMFALSLAPHFKSAWSQWMSKLISISLWGFVAYVCIFYTMAILEYNLKADLASYVELMKNVNSANNLDVLGTIGMNSLGSTCMYVVGCFIGVKLLSMVPEVASWLIPGGVSSSAGGSLGGVGAAAGGAIGGAVGAAAGGAALTGAKAVAGAGQQMAAGYASVAQQNLNWGSNSNSFEMKQSELQRQAMKNFSKRR